MKYRDIDADKLRISAELSRSGSAKQFEDRLRSSIEQIGLVEPLKVAPLNGGCDGFVVIDGIMRLRAIHEIRNKDASRFRTVPAYVFDYEKRFEIRFQSDIYQDLLPSQLATLVEHLHASEGVRKSDIARYIGVSSATLRNYTGLWRLMQRGGIFSKIVQLMDVGVIPASNPYAWLRLKREGVRFVIEAYISDGMPADSWIDRLVTQARLGSVTRLPLEFIEEVTGGLPAEYYRVDEAVRSVKKGLGLKRKNAPAVRVDATDAMVHLEAVQQRSVEPVLRVSAKSFQAYLA